MPKRTDELVHEMPLTKTVRLKFRRIDVKYNESKKRSEFKYQLANWPSSHGDAPTATINVEDWDDSDNKPERHTLKNNVEKTIDDNILTILMNQLSS